MKKRTRKFNWGLTWVTLGCLLFWAVVLATCAGCGVWVEIETNPETGAITVLYENRRPFAPENATVRTPDGWEIIMGEQPAQAAFIETVFKAGMIYGGVPPVE